MSDYHILKEMVYSTGQFVRNVTCGAIVNTLPGGLWKKAKKSARLKSELEEVISSVRKETGVQVEYELRELQNDDLKGLELGTLGVTAVPLVAAYIGLATELFDPTLTVIIGEAIVIPFTNIFRQMGGSEASLALNKHPSPNDLKLILYYQAENSPPKPVKSDTDREIDWYVFRTLE